MTGRLRALGKDAAIALRRAAPVTRRLPSFVVLGAQKAGTSSLFAQLVEHPRVLGGVRKEIHYFDRRARSVSWYRACFPTEAHHRAVQRRVGAPTITGEATPFYLLHPAAPERLAAVIPDARLIVVVRDPVQRAVSGYHHAARFGDEHRPIEDALDPDTEEPFVDDAAWFDRDDCPARLRGYLARGRYAEQLERWYRRFPPSSSSCSSPRTSRPAGARSGRSDSWGWTVPCRRASPIVTSAGTARPGRGGGSARGVLPPAQRAAVRAGRPLVAVDVSLSGRGGGGARSVGAPLARRRGSRIPRRVPARTAG